MQRFSSRPPIRAASPAALLALLGALALAACAEENPPPTQTLSPGQSPNATAYDSIATTPLGSEPAQPATTVGTQPMAPAPLPQTATSAPSSNKLGTASVNQGAGGILLPVTTRFLSDRPNTIEVSIQDAQAADRVQLVMPDGSAVDAYQLDREFTHATDTGSTGVSLGVGVSGGSSSGVQPSVGFGFPLFGGTPQSPQRDEVNTKARILVPDMAAYRANWQHAILRIYLGEKSISPRKMEMAAPAPP
jgi:hypothetical protein